MEIRLTTYSKFVILVFLLAIFVGICGYQSNVIAASGDVLWAKSTVTATARSQFLSTTTDKDGNIIAVGWLDSSAESTFDFGNSVALSLNTGFANNILIVKYNSSGVAQWAKSITTTTEDTEFVAVATDKDGNIYAAGDVHGYTGTLDFGSGITISGGSANNSGAILVKYNANGTPLWARSGTNTLAYRTTFTGVSTDQDGNIYVVGDMDRNTSIYNYGDGVTISGGNTGSENPIIVKYNPSGTAQWAKSTISPSEGTEFVGVTTDLSGNAFVVGKISGSVSINFGNEISAAGFSDGGYNSVIVKYSPTGNALWAKSTTLTPLSYSSSWFYDAATDKDGNVYSVGIIDGDGTYGFGDGVTTSCTSGSYSNAVIVKYNSSGTAQWAKSTGAAPSSSEFMGVATDSNSNVYAAAYLYTTDPYNFGDGVTSSGSTTLVKYNSSGVAQWAKSYVSGPTSQDMNYWDVSVDSSNNIFAGGFIKGNGAYNLGNDISITPGSNSYYNPLLVKLEGDTTGGSEPGPEATIEPTGTGNSSTNSNQNQSSSSSTSAAACNNTAPFFAPNLFQINLNDTTARLFFTPLIDTNKYYIAYGSSSNAEGHGVEITLSQLGVQNFLVESLTPNTTYYFKIRGQKGCIPGGWSNIMKVVTKPKGLVGIVSFYKNKFINNIVSTFTSNKPSVAGASSSLTSNPITATPTPPPTVSTPTSNPEDINNITPTSKTPQVSKKTCFLFWCW